MTADIAPVAFNTHTFIHRNMRLQVSIYFSPTSTKIKIGTLGVSETTGKEIEEFNIGTIVVSEKTGKECEEFNIKYTGLAVQLLKTCFIRCMYVYLRF